MNEVPIVEPATNAFADTLKDHGPWVAMLGLVTWLAIRYIKDPNTLRGWIPDPRWRPYLAILIPFVVSVPKELIIRGWSWANLGSALMQAILAGGTAILGQEWIIRGAAGGHTEPKPPTSARGIATLSLLLLVSCANPIGNAVVANNALVRAADQAAVELRKRCVEPMKAAPSPSAAQAIADRCDGPTATYEAVVTTQLTLEAAIIAAAGGDTTKLLGAIAEAAKVGYRLAEEIKSLVGSKK